MHCDLPFDISSSPLFFFNATPTTEIYTLSLHDALPISLLLRSLPASEATVIRYAALCCLALGTFAVGTEGRSEEHTSELQSLTNLVCRLLLEKKKVIIIIRAVRSHVTMD